jgi:translation initiation factor 1
MAEETCKTCGLPLSLCVCKTLDQQTQKIKVYVEKRKFGKAVTVIEGVTGNAKDTAKKLKSQLATGGTLKDDHIELLGDHLHKIKDILVKMGYSEDQLEIVG